jgi:hypothetical protein
MKHTFNWSASTNEAELVLKGEYNDEDISDISRLFLIIIVKMDIGHSVSESDFRTLVKVNLECRTSR